jgi:hypothetical protein
MAVLTRVTFKTVYLTDKAKWSRRMVFILKEAGKKVKSMVSAHQEILMARNTGAFGRMMNLMAKDGNSFQMGLALAWNMSTEK